jgi:hypothetical protein
MLVSLPPQGRALPPRVPQAQGPWGLLPQASPVSLPPQGLALQPRGPQAQGPRRLQPQASRVSLPLPGPALVPRESLVPQALSPLRETPALQQQPLHRDRPVKYRRRRN